MLNTRFQTCSRALSPLVFVALGVVPLHMSVAVEEEADISAAPIITLSDFEVQANTTRGWLATNSFSASRMNELIQNVPVSISVITDEFIRDIGARTVNEALFYTAGAMPGGNTRLGTLTLRGFESGFLYRDGLKQYYQGWTANVDRVEVIRGPAAIMHGVARPGGVINYITRKPSFEEYRGNIMLSTGSWSRREAAVDVSGPVGLLGNEGQPAKAAFRTGVYVNKADGWQDKNGALVDMEQYYASLVLRPFKRLEISLDYQNNDNVFGTGSGPILNEFGNAFLELPATNNYMAGNARYDLWVRTFTVDAKLQVTDWLVSRTMYSRLWDALNNATLGPSQRNPDGNGSALNQLTYETHDVTFFSATLHSSLAIGRSNNNDLDVWL